MKRRNFLLALITAPFAAALAKVPFAAKRHPEPADCEFPILRVKPLQRRPGFALFPIDPGNHIEVVERWTREGGIRRIGDGPWEQIWGAGPVPFVVAPGVSHLQTTRWISPQESAAAQTFAQGPR